MINPVVDITYLVYFISCLPPTQICELKSPALFNAVFDVYLGGNPPSKDAQKASIAGLLELAEKVDGTA